MEALAVCVGAVQELRIRLVLAVETTILVAVSRKFARRTKAAVTRQVVKAFEHTHNTAVHRAVARMKPMHVVKPVSIAQRRRNWCCCPFPQGPLRSGLETGSSRRCACLVERCADLYRCFGAPVVAPPR